MPPRIVVPAFLPYHGVGPIRSFGAKTLEDDVNKSMRFDVVHKSMQGSYIHGTAPSEQQRLATLNRLTNGAFVAFLDIADGMRVLEVGSGLGLLAAEVATAAEGVHVIGVEVSADQINAAVEHEAVDYAQGDAHHLEFADQEFDLVYARFVLEHLSDPVTVLREMRRVTKVGGQVAVCENDVSLLRVDPPCPMFEAVWQGFDAFQRMLGGDASIGRRLYRLFCEAGLPDARLSLQPDVHWHGSSGFTSWIQNLIDILEGARQGLLEADLCSSNDLDAGIAELKGLINDCQGSSCFVWNRALARRT